MTGRFRPAFGWSAPAWRLRRPAVLAAALAGVLLAGATAIGGAQERPVALVNASVVDVERGVVLPSQVIVVRNGRITSTGSMRTERIPASATRVDLRGAFVIPGLWDMHTHVAGPTRDVETLVQYHGALFLRHGVTAVRDLGGDAEVLAGIDAVASGQPGRMPRFVHAGPKVVIRAQAPQEDLTAAIAAIAASRGRRSPMVKFASDVPPPAFRGAREACAAARVPCVAHIPEAAADAWLFAPDAGSYEHLFNVAEHVSTLPAAAVFAAREEYRAPTLRQRALYKLRLRRRPEPPERLLPAIRDTTRDAAFFGRMAATGVWMTPTLLLHHWLTRSVDVLPSARDSLYTLAPPPVVRPAATNQDPAALWILWNGLVTSMARHGVRMLAGTDQSAGYVPGAALHAELALLQQAGVSPAEALRMATLNPARYFQATDSSGAIAAGRVADLVVLRRNPLDDIRRVGEIDMVMTRGLLLRGPALDSLAATARRAAATLREAMRREGR